MTPLSDPADPRSPERPDRELLPIARIYELLDEFGITETDALKHVLEDAERLSRSPETGGWQPGILLRLCELAEIAALEDHNFYFHGNVVYAPPKDKGGHSEPFETCNNKDCALIRTVVALLPLPPIGDPDGR